MQALKHTLPAFNFMPPQEVRAEMNERAKEYEAMEAKRVRAERLGRARIPSGFRGANLESCHASARNWALKTSQGSTSDLLIKGQVGSGKTYTACAILNYLLGFIDGRYCTTADILNDAQSAFSGAETTENVIRRYANVPVLVVDELGASKPTDWSISTLFEVIRRRYENMRPTVYTTMYEPESLMKKLVTPNDDQIAMAICSRLTDADRLTITSPDRRGHGRV